MLNYSDIFNSYSVGKVNFLLLDKSITFPDDKTLDIYEKIYVGENIPWTVLSYKIYDTIDYWWVLANINRGKWNNENSSFFYAPEGEYCYYIRKENLLDILNSINS